MNSNTLKIHIKKLISKIAYGQKLTLEERLLISKHARSNREISDLYNKARKIQQQRDQKSSDVIDKLLYDMNIGISDKEEAYNPKIQDLGDWFSGAPPWVARS